MKVLTVRRCFLAFFTLLLASRVSYSQWEIQNSGVTADLWDVCFVDSLYGWAVGDSGTVIATTDGGKTWLKKMEQVDTLEFREVQFLNRHVGFVGGNRIEKFPTYWAFHALLLRTANGGISWERCDTSFGPALTFINMQFLDNYNGWIALNNIGSTSWEDRRGVLLKTTDSGTSWSVLQESDSVVIGAVTFTNLNQGYAFWGAYFDNFNDTDVYVAQDGGKTWSLAGEIREDLVKQARAVSPDTLWAIGFKTSRSQDGGKSWITWNWFNPILEGQKRFVPTDFEVFSSSYVWLLGGAWSNPNDNEGILLSTNDAGQTWMLELQVPGRSFAALSVACNKEAWIVGTDGIILHQKNSVTGICTEDEVPLSFRISQNYPNPFNPGTTIEYYLQRGSNVHLEVFDILGRKVKTLVNSNQESGLHTAAWDGKNEANEFVASGIYVYRLTVNGFISSKKMILSR